MNRAAMSQRLPRKDCKAAESLPIPRVGRCRNSRIKEKRTTETDVRKGNEQQRQTTAKENRKHQRRTGAETGNVKGEQAQKQETSNGNRRRNRKHQMGAYSNRAARSHFALLSF